MKLKLSELQRSHTEIGRDFIMCDCVSSPHPITYPGVRIRKLGFISCNSGPTISRIELFPTIGYINLNSKPSKCHNSDGLKLSCRKVRSENYELFDEELGFYEEKPKRVSKIETQKSSNLDGEEEVKKIRLKSTPEEAAGISFVNEKKEENGSGGEISGSSSIDFLELEKEKKSMGSLVEDDEIVRVEEGSDEVGKFDGRMGLRSGRQMMRRSSMLAKQVISVKSALSLGFVSQLWVDTSSWVVFVVEVRPSLLSGEIERFLLEEVYQVGDVVLVEDEAVLENGLQMIGLDTLVGYNVVTPSRQSIGKVRGYTFNINSGSLELLELDSFGISIIPSSLVSTYALFVEDVIEVASDTVVVHEAAASRLQRLTKGFWDTPNVETPIDEFGEYSDFQRRPARSDNGRNSRKSFRSRKFPLKTRGSEDDLDLPMDYL
ncbi:hypothetical protein BVC80_1767g28 [Macleaya cordata]|uniref:PRC-barrel-like n=1 Tax=Macleaya cordata TaxID=56857 RepID=A0A200QTC2_MACCD|nr:hypothetical protein BVC80_1767g28 [Macleaya cordata]